eukprot:scaffold600_cov385-Prasinococcus_capsulatus_cf.AAC.22
MPSGGCPRCALLAAAQALTDSRKASLELQAGVSSTSRLPVALPGSTTSTHSKRAKSCMTRWEPRRGMRTLPKGVSPPVRCSAVYTAGCTPSAAASREGWSGGGQRRHPHRGSADAACTGRR